MYFSKVKIEIFIPEKYIDILREKLNEVGALGGKKYDNVMSVSKVTGYWRPLDGSTPFDGEINEISKAEECKVEICTDIKKTEEIIKVIKDVHPYEEPVINIIPLLNDKFYLNTDF